MSFYIFLPTLAILVLALAAMVFLCIWTYRDARARGLNAMLWLLVVLLAPGLIGLILYLAIGRNQASALCGQCGAALCAEDQFCRKCGAATGPEGDHAKPRAIPKGGNRGPLIGFIVCMGVIVLMVAGLLGAAALAPMLYRNHSRAQNAPITTQAEEGLINSFELDGLSAGVIQSGWGNQWNLRFAKLGADHRKEFTFSQDQELVVVSKVSQGTLQITLSAANGTRYETHVLAGGEERFPLQDFEPGTLQVTLTADATEGEISFTIK